jgi:hypothetical protein
MWFDLSAADTDQAGEFYSALFGWAVAPADGPAGSSVTIADPGGAQLALFKPHAGPS